MLYGEIHLHILIFPRILVPANLNLSMNFKNTILAICLSSTFLIAQKLKTKVTLPTAPIKAAEVLKAENFSGLKFRSIGPALTSGRIADIAVNPKNSSEYYVAVASGGVWKTINKGTTFEPIFDSQASYSIGCVSIDPNNTSTIWVGSGENNNQRAVAYGDGIYKSTDAGKTWQNMGLKTSEHIAKIVVHPSDPNTVYVAAYGPVWAEGGERGVYKTTDGGKTWKCVKSISAFTGCNDLVMDPRNPEVIYAAFHQRMRKVFTYIGGGPETSLFKSTDGGTTWQKLSGGLPNGDLGRIGLAISPVNPDYLYTVIEGPADKQGVYRTTDRGASWEKRSDFSSTGNYYNEIDCDPHDVNKIYMTDSYYKMSTDGGKTIKNLGEINKHVDNHSIWVDPKDPKHIMVGCDGGIYETYDHAGSWDFKSNLPIVQFYKVATDNDLPFYHVHGGTQDNFSLGGPSRTTSANGITNADWYVTSTGDGFESQVDPKDPNIIYAQSQYGGLNRFDRKSGENLWIKPVEGENEPANRWNWDAPLLISQHDNKRLYFGANKVYRTDDQGNSWKAISGDLSRGLDRNTFKVMGKVQSVDAVAKNQSTDIYGQTTAIAESKFNENMLWVGTDDGLIQLSVDGGKTWKAIDNIPGVPARSYVQQIVSSLHDKNTAYVCFNHHRYGDFKPYVIKTKDAGLTWEAIIADLPTKGSVYTIAEDHLDPNLLFVGTEFGVFFSNTAGKQWLSLKNGLPTIAVRDIEIQRRENDLVLATFGRGFYILDDYSPLRFSKVEEFKTEAKIFAVKDALMYIEKYPLGLRDKGHLGSSYYAAANPKPGAVFTYYLKDDILKLKEIRQKKEADSNAVIKYPSPDSLRLEDTQEDPYLLFTIKDATGNVVRHLKAPAKKGMHRISWDFRYGLDTPLNARRKPADDELFGGEDIGHLALPGTYTVSMSKYVDGQIKEIGNTATFNCKLLKQGSLQSTDMSENVTFYKTVSAFTKRYYQTADVLGSIESRTANISKAILDLPNDAKGFLEKNAQIKSKSIQLHIDLWGDSSLQKREFETSPSVSDRLFTIVSTLWVSTAAIPKMYKDSFNIAQKQFETIQQKVDTLNTELTALEKEIHAKGGPYLGR